MLAGII